MGTPILEPRAKLRRGRELSLPAALVLCLFNLEAYCAGWGLTPAVGIGEIFIDNIELAEPGDEEEEYLTQAILAFNANRLSDRLKADINYRMQNLFALRESERNQTFHQLEARATGRLYAESLFVDALAAYNQQIIDPSLPTNVQNLFENNNLTDVATILVSPYFQHPVGRGAETTIRYTAGLIEYEEDEFQGDTIQDARTEQVLLALGTEDDEARHSWLANYRYERADFEMAREFEYEQADLSLRIGLTNSFSLVGLGGLESDLEEDSTSAGLDRAFWEAGFRLTGRYNELELRGGRRFFGDTWFGQWRHERRRLKAYVSYQEGPTTRASQLSLTPSASGFEPPDRDPDGLAPLTDEIFVQKDLNARVAIEGNRTELQLDVFNFRSEFIDAEDVAVTRGAGVTAIRRMAPRTDLVVGLEWRRNTDRDNGDGNEDYRFTTGLNHELGSRTTGAIEYTQLRREPGNQYRVNWLVLRVSRRFGAGQVRGLDGRSDLTTPFR